MPDVLRELQKLPG